MPGGTYLSSDGDTNLGTTDATKYSVSIQNGADYLGTAAYGGYSAGLSVFNKNVVNMSGGHAYEINGYDSSTINISGGTVGSAPIFLSDSSILNISGGTVSQVILSGTNTGKSVVNITGGSVQLINGGFGGASIVNVSGGTVTDLGGGYNGGVTFNVTGGTIGSASPGSGPGLASIMNVSGGSIGNILGGGGTTNLYGGTIGAEGIRMLDSSVLNVYGTGLGLALTGVSSDSYGTYTGYTLSGTLQNGQSLNGVLFRDYNGGYQITNINNPNGPTSPLNFFAPAAAGAPEPGSFVLVAFAGGCAASVVRARRRKRAK